MPDLPRLRPLDSEAPAPLDDADAAPPDGIDRDAMEEAYDDARTRLKELGRVLRAEGERALLVVVQARDAGGKDSTTRKVFRRVDPQSIRVASFRAPCGEELRHDFLWRVHREVPPQGTIGVFVRSHYEDVIVPRVRGEIDDAEAERRMRQIADFERMLAENGVTVVKLFLHVSREEQARRLRERLHRSDKHWKWNPSDLDDRARWDAFTRAYREVFARTSLPWAPWHVVPADDKPVRNWLVARRVVDVLEGMDLRHPRLTAGDAEVRRWEKRLGDG